LSNATKHAIILTLNRLGLGLIKNLSAINFAIAPLGAILSIDNSCDPGVVYDGVCAYKFRIASLSDVTKVWRRQACPRNDDTVAADNLEVPAFYTDDNCQTNGVKRRIYPMLLAAECIVRSLLPNDGTIKIKRIE
jgi:hypothetical protein